MKGKRYNGMPYNMYKESWGCISYIFVSFVLKTFLGEFGIYSLISNISRKDNWISINSYREGRGGEGRDIVKEAYWIKSLALFPDYNVSVGRDGRFLLIHSECSFVLWSSDHLPFSIGLQWNISNFCWIWSWPNKVAQSSKMRIVMPKCVGTADLIQFNPKRKLYSPDSHLTHFLSQSCPVINQKLFLFLLNVLHGNWMQ